MRRTPHCAFRRRVVARLPQGRSRVPPAPGEHAEKNEVTRMLRVQK
ncbi:hypothetical protein RLOC_00010383 [Lonchura striata]|uniref:Uncharacterized protein n=1 Tax=Lonchura striata TaxID=40157 RepID=A0A218V6L5_9PASE|nr:hypothetical protein RLOC_00010383 [Lonchura striata domestica]